MRLVSALEIFHQIVSTDNIIQKKSNKSVYLPDYTNTCLKTNFGRVTNGAYK